MGRATSLNYEIHFPGGDVIEPSKLGEFGEGEEGRVDVADGNRKYKVPDNIYDIGETEVTILITRDRYEYKIMQAWTIDRVIQDVVVKGVDSAGNVEIAWRFKNCALAMGKKSEFDRDSKAIDKKTYFLCPEYIDEIPMAPPATVEQG